MIRIKKEMNDVSGIMEVMNLGQQVTGTKQDRTAEIYLFSFDAMKQLGRSPDQIFDDMKVCCHCLLKNSSTKSFTVMRSVRDVSTPRTYKYHIFLCVKIL